jgi:hypothetical protein
LILSQVLGGGGGGFLASGFSSSAFSSSSSGWVGFLTAGAPGMTVSAGFSSHGLGATSDSLPFFCSARVMAFASFLTLLLSFL